MNNIPESADKSNVVQNAVEKINELKASLPEQAKIAQTPKKLKFEIELYDEIQVGENIDNIQLQKVIMEHPIIIEAANKKELDEHAARFKLCKQRMKIIRVLNDPTTLSTDQISNFMQQPQNGKIAVQPINQPSAATVEKTKPKYYSIGGIDIKNDNGKIYQKQWMKLTEKEMQNFRLVNDSNNKLVSLNGKHLEMKKWVLVDSSDNDFSFDEDIDN